MSWTRLDDGWTDQQLLAGLSHQTRWHYLCMIQFCSRTKRFDGFIRAVDARRCSDVDNPDQAVADLRDIGIIHPAADGYRVHRMEEDHAPPLSVRTRTESNKQSQQRHRAHKAGDHSTCLPQNCEHTTSADGHADSHADNVADTRTVQDRLRTKALPPQDESYDYPTDPRAVEWRKKIDTEGISSVAQLIKVAKCTPEQARKMWAAAFPESRAA